MTLILNSPATPGAHALVIGVGDYPWLPNGSASPTFDRSGGMGQLSSAPVSARELARWFLSDFSHPTLPRASLEILLSDAGSSQLTDPAGVAHEVERATLANIKRAILAWFRRGGGSAENLLLFFFCGHGLGKGNQTILLAEDFGSQPGNLSLTCAIDFNQLYLGMDQCTARKQCFFVDACRTGSPFSLNTLTYFGDPVIPPEAKLDPQPRSAPVFYAAVPGATAYGRPGRSSFFTEALLKACLGAGADDATGDWTVETHALPRAIHFYLQRSVARTAAQGSLSSVDGLAEPFAIHRLPGPPVVPVEVTCRPEAHNASGALRVSGNGAVLEPAAPESGPWDLDLGYGQYRFEVRLAPPSASPAPVDKEVRPPYRRVELPVP